MKNLVVAGVVLLIVYVGPQREQADPGHALWAMGLLIITAYALQQLTRWLRLPDLLGWLAAGVMLGATGLQVIVPRDLPLLAFLGSMAGVWVGFRVGGQVSIPSGFHWREMLRLALLTMTTAALAALGIALVAESPWWLALLLGALASLWGGFTSIPTPARRESAFLASVGTGVALVLLSAVLAVLQLQDLISSAATGWILRVWGALGAGALLAVPFRYLSRRCAGMSTLAGGLIGFFLALALFIQELRLLSLPCGFGAGLVLAVRRVPGRRVRFLLRLVSPLSFLLFFAFLGASLDLRELWPLRPEVGWIVLVQAVVLVGTRGLVPSSLLFPSPGQGSARRRLGWLLLPRGALLFELVFHPHHGLPSLLGADAAQLLAQVVTADLLIHLILFLTLSRVVQQWYPSAPEPKEADPAAPVPAQG